MYISPKPLDTSISSPRDLASYSFTQVSRQATRRARALFVILSLLGLSACGSAQRSPQRHERASLKTLGARGAQGASRSTTQTSALNSSELWVIEGQVNITVDLTRELLSSLKSKLNGIGEVTQQTLNERSGYTRADLTLRVKPKELPALLKWLRARGDISREEISREEVSRQLLAQEITISNAQKTLARLKVFIDKDQLKVEDVLRVEREMSRLREVIEKSTREHELLKSRVSLATLKLTVSERPAKIPTAPNAKLFISGRPTLMLNGAGSPDLGWGISLFNPEHPAHFHVDFDRFAATDQTFLMIGGGVYSEFFGAGRRRYLNPHLGFKFGYANDEGGRFAFGGTFGIELLRTRYVFLNLKAEGLGVTYDSGLEWNILGGLDLAIVY